MTSEEAPSDRRHDLDALRATAILLGIGLHGSLAYVTAGVTAVLLLTYDRWVRFTWNIE